MAKKEAAKTVETKTVIPDSLITLKLLKQNERDARGTENLRYIYTGAG